MGKIHKRKEEGPQVHFFAMGFDFMRVTHLADRKKMRGYRSMIFSVVTAIGTLDFKVSGVK